jgi:hypothetical protein
MVPANMDDAMKMLDAALGMQQCVLRFLAGEDAAGLPAHAVADQSREVKGRAGLSRGCWLAVC